MNEFDFNKELLNLTRGLGQKGPPLAEEMTDVTFTADALEELADKMGDMLLGYSGSACADMLLELIGRPRLPPIPHPYGTYLWAREVCARLPASARGVESKSAGWAVMVPVTVAQWNEMKWPHAAFVATDWEVIP